MEKIYASKDSSGSDGGEKKVLKLNEPISNELRIAIRQHNLTKSWFTRLIDGRKLFFNINQFANLTQLEQCADLSNPHYLLLQCMGQKSVDCDHAASHLGKCQLICGVVKNLLRRSSQSVYYLPADLLIKHGISQQDLISFNEKVLRSKRVALKDLTFDLCTRAYQHLNSSRELKSKVPKDVRLVLVQSVGCENFLQIMEKHDFDLMNPKLKRDSKSRFLLKIISAKFRNSY